jgi:hypothetical protein
MPSPTCGQEVKYIEHVFHPLKLELNLNFIKTAVSTTQKAPCITIKNINWLVLFKEMFAIYLNSHTKHINTFCGKN